VIDDPLRPPATSIDGAEDLHDLLLREQAPHLSKGAVDHQPGSERKKKRASPVIPMRPSVYLAPKVVRLGQKMAQFVHTNRRHLAVDPASNKAQRYQ
jgi:hypothetical protein